MVVSDLFPWGPTAASSVVVAFAKSPLYDGTGWLGWMWRGTDRTGRVTTLEMEIEEQRRLARAAMDERDAARAVGGVGGGHCRRGVADSNTGRRW